MGVTVDAGSIGFDGTMAGPKVRWKKPPTLEPDSLLQNITLIPLITEETGAFQTPPPPAPPV